MASKEQKREALYKKLELLREVTNSAASPQLDGSSVVLDASEYIQKLKRKVERLKQDTGTSEMISTTDSNPSPEVTVEALEKGYRIDVFSERSCSGLLVSILEAFEELGLEVVDANVSCSESFHLEAVAGDNIQGEAEGIDAEVVRQVVFQAITNWNQNCEE